MTTHGRIQRAGFAIPQDDPPVLPAAPVAADHDPNCQPQPDPAVASHQQSQLFAETNHWLRVEHAAEGCASWEGQQAPSLGSGHARQSWSAGQLRGIAAQAAASCDAAGRCGHDAGNEEQVAANGLSKQQPQPAVAHVAVDCQGPNVGPLEGSHEKGAQEPAD